MGVVTGIVNSSEAMAQTMCFLSSQQQTGTLTKGWDRGPAHLSLIALPHQARFSGGPFPLMSQTFCAPSSVLEGLLTQEMTFLLMYVILWGGRNGK